MNHFELKRGQRNGLVAFFVWHSIRRETMRLAMHTFLCAEIIIRWTNYSGRALPRWILAIAFCTLAESVLVSVNSFLDYLARRKAMSGEF